MKYKIELKNKLEQFEANEGEILLDAAIRSKSSIPYSCRSGTCRSCLILVLGGEVEQDFSTAPYIQLKEYEAGWRLACCAAVKSDCVIMTKR